MSRSIAIAAMGLKHRIDVYAMRVLRCALLVAVAALSAFVTAPAIASPVTIHGSPLQLTLTDEGGVAVYREGSMSPDLVRPAGFGFFPFKEAAPFGVGSEPAPRPWALLRGKGVASTSGAPG